MKHFFKIELPQLGNSDKIEMLISLELSWRTAELFDQILGRGLLIQPSKKSHNAHTLTPVFILRRIKLRAEFSLVHSQRFERGILTA